MSASSKTSGLAAAESTLRFGRLFGIGGLASGATILGATLFLNIFILRRHGAAFREDVLFAAALVAGLYAVILITLSITQLWLMFEQVQQAEEIGSRKDDRLIEAIESLRTDLKRLPSPPTMNWALFNLPNKRGDAE